MNCRKIILFALIMMRILAPGFLCAQEENAVGKYKNNSCAWCHSKRKEGSSGSIVVKEWEMSVHRENGVTCADCHGGNPAVFDIDAMDEDTAGFTGVPERASIPDMCSRCHSDSSRMSRYNIPVDQLETYKNSKHGKLLFENGDENVPTCVTCHGKHNIMKASDKRSPVYYMNLPETCAKCHNDPEKMKPYGIPVTQYTDYKAGIHGQVHYGKFPDKKPAIAPTCISCHGKHAGRDLSPEGVINICKQCHLIQVEKFGASPHSRALAVTGAPTCTTCHNKHRNEIPSTEMLPGGTKDTCRSCHEQSSGAAALGTDIKKTIEGAHNTLHQARTAIEEMEKGRLNTDILENKFTEAVTHIHMNHAVTHELNLVSTKEHMAQTTAFANEIITAYNEYKLELEKRFRLYLFAITMIVTAVILIYAKLLLIRSKDKKKKE